MRTKDPDTYARIKLYALIGCLEEALSWLRDVADQKRIADHKGAHNISGKGETATPTPSQLRAIRLADGRQRAHTWAAQVLGKPKQASTRKQSIASTFAHTEMAMFNNAKPQPAPDDMVPGNRVTITWDRYWRWNTSTTRMPKTDYEGFQGTVVRTTKCFVWVVVDDTNVIIKKRKHNVKVVAVDH